MDWFVLRGLPEAACLLSLALPGAGEEDDPWKDEHDEADPEEVVGPAVTDAGKLWNVVLHVQFLVHDGLTEDFERNPAAGTFKGKRFQG